MKSLRVEKESTAKLYDSVESKLTQYKAEMKTFKGHAETRLFEALDSLGVDLQAYHSGTFIGNHMFKVLKVSDSIDGPKLITEALASRPDLQFKFYQLLLTLGEIFRFTSCIGFLTQIETETLETKIQELKNFLIQNFQNMTTTPKMHMLLTHFLPFVKKHGTIGLFTEQSIESLHAELNFLMR